MTTGSGVYINPTEKDPIRQNTVIRQLIEGRSNAVGIATLAVGGATSTTVTARNCNSSSAVILQPASASAATVMATTYVLPANVKRGSFIISHAANSTSGVQFWWVCLG